MCNCWDFDCLFVVSSVGFAQGACIYKGQVASSKYTEYFLLVILPSCLAALLQMGSCPLYLHTMAYLSA